MPRASSLLLAVGLVCLGHLCACVSSETPPPAGDVVAPPPTSAPLVDAGTRTPLPPPVPFSIVREPDTGCVATTTAQPITLETGMRYLTDLESVGGRRLARAFSGDGFFVFDADGSGAPAGPLAPGEDVRTAGSLKNVLSVGVATGSAVTAQRFLPTGAKAGSPETLGPALPGRPVAVGRSGEKAAVVWAAPGPEIRARVLDDEGRPGPAIVLESGAEFEDLSIVIAPSTSNDASAFLVVWALRRTALSAYRVYAALVGSEGVVGLQRVVFGSDAPVRLVELVTHKSGAMALANLASEPLALPLDVLGRLTAPAHLLEGTNDPLVGGGHGLALHGDTVAVIARHTRDVHALRILDLAGSPRDGWVCLDAPSAEAFHLGSVADDRSGWAAVIATPAGSALLRMDRTGRSPL